MQALTVQPLHKDTQSLEPSVEAPVDQPLGRLLPQAATPALSTGGMHMALLTNAWSLVMWPPSQF